MKDRERGGEREGERRREILVFFSKCSYQPLQIFIVFGFVYIACFVYVTGLMSFSLSYSLSFLFSGRAKSLPKNNALQYFSYIKIQVKTKAIDALFSPENIIFSNNLERKSVCKCFATAQNCSQAKRRNERVLNFVQQVFFLFINGKILNYYQSLSALYLSWTSSQRTGTRPPSCLLLENCLYG